ncbi:MAG TPA: hypothetical protein VMV74_04275 [Bacteroidales bacterium]|nr:hypothetical protein [Bacteroidales bacterium]
MKKGLTAIFICLIFCSLSLKGQYYDTGQDPARLRWEQIRTPHFRVIYPATFAPEAEKYAKILEESFLKVSVIYPEAGTNLPVILHNYSMQSNGYVSWAPRRMELYPLPGQDNLPMDPAIQLIVHEATHVAQLSSLNKGLSRIMSFFAGEQIVGLNALMIPQWAFEGDAVYAETAFTGSGRGRSNAFMQDARALALSDPGVYNYDKMLGGSYRNYTPNHYVFGYLMMNQLRSMSQTAWGEAVSNVSRNSVTLNPVNQSLKRTVGLTKKSLYEVTFDSLLKEWQNEARVTTEDYPRLNTAPKNDYISHQMPHRLDDGRILSIRTSLSKPPAFVITDAAIGREKVLTTTGYVYPYVFSYSDSYIVWAELHSDPRWNNLDYSVIKKISISGGPITQLTFRSRYTAPDLSPDGRTIVAVSTTPEFAYSLVFIDAYTGEKLMDLAIPGNLIIQRPAWSSDGQAVTMVTLSPSGEGIRTYYPTGKKWVVNKSESRTDIIQAEIHNDTLLWLAQGDGSDNIYRLAPDGTESRITHSRFGISGFSVSDNEIIFSDYSSSGFNISAVTSGTTIYNSVHQSLNIMPKVAELPSATEDLPASDSVILKKGPYRKAAHLFNFHSWLPLYADIEKIKTDPSSIRPGVTLMSQNNLSTLFTTLGYEYSDGNHYLHSQIEWRGWYPVIEAGMTYGGKQIISKPSGITLQPSDIGNDMNLNASIYLPLYFTYGKFRQLFMPAIYINYRNRFIYVNDINAFNEGYVLLTGRLYFSNTFRSAYRDIYPRWGQVIDMRITSAPWDKNIYSSLKYVRGTLFLPGFASNHSLVIRAGYEDQSPSGILLHYNRNPYPRGYHNLLSEKLLSLSADYTMPFIYPDLAAGGFFYLKRIRGSLFIDGATGTGTLEYANNNEFTEGSTDFGSFGGELLADFYLLRFPFEISAGVSGGYIPAENRSFVEGVLSVNIYGSILGKKR